MNRCLFQGNLTRDPELRYTPSGKAVVSFGVAVSEGKNKTTFIDCDAWDQAAESIAQYFKKGKPIIVETRYKEDSWEKDGQKRTKAKFIVDKFYFVSGTDKKNDKSDKKEDGVKTDEKPVENTDAGSSNDDENIPF